MDISIAEGKVKQYQGPFKPNEEITFISDMAYKLGISIGEKDFMSFQGINRINLESIPIQINGEEIQIGKTYIYEPGFPLTNLKLKFPKGCPDSTLIEITTLQKVIE